MDLRIEVDQAEAFRRGIDCPKSIVLIEVTPSELGPQTRELIGKRMIGIDVCQLGADAKPRSSEQGQPVRVKALVPTLAGLIETVYRDEACTNADFKVADLETIEGCLEEKIEPMTAETLADCRAKKDQLRTRKAELSQKLATQAEAAFRRQ